MNRKAMEVEEVRAQLQNKFQQGIRATFNKNKLHLKDYEKDGFPLEQLTKKYG